MPLDDQFAAGKHVDGLLHLAEQIEIRRLQLSGTAVERQADQAHDDRVALAEYAGLVVAEHPFDLLELFLDTLLCLDALNQRGAFRRCPTEALVESPQLFLHVGKAQLVVGILLLERLLLVAQILDVGDEFDRQSVGPVVHVGDDVGGTRDSAELFFPEQHELFGRQVLVANLQDDLRQVDGVLGFVVCLLGKVAREVRIITVLVELTLRVRKQLLRLAEGYRGVTAHTSAVCLGKQLTRFAEVLRLDRDKFCIPVERGRFHLASFGALQITALEVANRVGELVLCVLPEVRRQLRRLCVGRVLAAFQRLGQRRLREPGRFRGVREVIGGFRGVGAYVLDVAAALQRLLRILILAHATLVGPRRQPFGFDRVGGRLGGIRVLEKCASKFVLCQS